jgi:hypothetical protein
MPVRFKPLSTGWPDDYQPPPEHPHSWRVYTFSTAERGFRCSTRVDVNALADVDAAQARLTYVHLTFQAQTGLPLQALYDEKKCHPTLTFKLHEHDAQPTKIWRIWGAGSVRVYFIYGPGKRIVILKTWVKRKDKLSSGEEGQLIALASEVLLAIEASAFESLEYED